jgi:hypothetical protein
MADVRVIVLRLVYSEYVLPPRQKVVSNAPPWQEGYKDRDFLPASLVQVCL